MVHVHELTSSLAAALSGALGGQGGQDGQGGQIGSGGQGGQGGQASGMSKAYVFRGAREYTKEQIQHALGVGARAGATPSAMFGQGATPPGAYPQGTPLLLFFT